MESVTNLLHFQTTFINDSLLSLGRESVVAIIAEVTQQLLKAEGHGHIILADLTSRTVKEGLQGGSYLVELSKARAELIVVKIGVGQRSKGSTPYYRRRKG